MNIDQLGEIDEIKQLKARYLRLVDERKWAAWGRAVGYSGARCGRRGTRRIRG
jgi:hypothetical protein